MDFAGGASIATFDPLIAMDRVHCDMLSPQNFGRCDVLLPRIFFVIRRFQLGQLPQIGLSALVLSVADLTINKNLNNMSRWFDKTGTSA